tara:strand:+ start:107 stop:322 length:216 start_codon:yes stop_codon:yes gene_type:complete
VDRTRVESSLLKGLGYDAATSTLEVEFHNGSVYVYEGVPQTVYSDIMGAESVGKAFNQLVKREGAYPYKRL